MIQLSDLIEALAATHPRIISRRVERFDAFSYDSRRVLPGELFVAVATERADGHDYIPAAIARGASGILCERPIEPGTFGGTCIVVDDTRRALIEWARYSLQRYRPRTIAITGSVGKTSTPAAIARVIGADRVSSEGVFTNENQNDLFGLPISLGRLSADHPRAVLELATGAWGEIRALAEIVRPVIAVVTNAGETRPDVFGSIDGVAREFGDLVATLPPNGWAVLNGDDPRVAALATLTRARVVQYGQAPGLDVRAVNVRVGRDWVRFDLVYHDQIVPVDLPLIGGHHVYTGLAAAAAGLIEGLSCAEIAERLADLCPLPGRLRPLPGRSGARLLDDSFNASPPSVRAAFAYLGTQPSPRIAILGDLTGLGRATSDWQTQIGEWAVQQGRVDALITRGEQAELAAQRARELGLPAERVVATHSADDAARAAARWLTPSATVLVKGSEEARMEQVVERLLVGAKPAEVLIRQDPGWKQRVFLSRERPTWVEIDLQAIGHNVERLKEIVGPGVEIMAVLKADAYGHGAVRVARTAILHGATQIATATLSEAIAIRRSGIDAPILILGFTPPWQAGEIVEYGLRVTLFGREVAAHLSQAAVRREAPPVPVHLKVDTGMARLGLAPAEVRPFLAEIARLPGIAVEGIFTHFACADDPDPASAQGQLARFQALLEDLDAAGYSFRYVHAANSAATLRLPESHFNLVRTGIAIYGLDPSPEVPCPPDFQPALTFKTRIAQVRRLKPGDSVSYGATWTAGRESVIATLPVGYGDGFRRAPKTWESVLVRGAWAPLVGRVCMDMAMIDVTEIPGVKAGDEVILIGRQGDQELSATEVARRLGTINYEVVTQILARVPRETP